MLDRDRCYGRDNVLKAAVAIWNDKQDESRMEEHLKAPGLVYMIRSR